MGESLEAKPEKIAGVEPGSLTFDENTKVRSIEAKSRQIAKAAEEAVGDPEQGESAINDSGVASLVAEKDQADITKLELDLNGAEDEEAKLALRAKLGAIKSEAFPKLSDTSEGQEEIARQEALLPGARSANETATINNRIDSVNAEGSAAGATRAAAEALSTYASGMDREELATKKYHSQADEVQGNFLRRTMNRAANFFQRRGWRD